MLHPLGLHAHLVAVGPTLRVAVWFEEALAPDRFKTFKRSASEAPFAHPACASASHLHKRLGVARATPVVVTLPRLGSYLPVPLPGLIAAWDLADFKGNRTTGAAAYLVDAALLPLGASMHALRRLVHDHAERYGAGFVSPAARGLADALDALRPLVAEGPLLPSLAPPASVHTAERIAPTSLVRDASARVVWVPPFALSELCALWRRLTALPFVAAAQTPAYLLRYSEREGLNTWKSETSPARLAVFLLELLDAEAARAGAPPKHIAPDHFREKGPRAEIAALHRDHGSCLFPDHPVFSPPAAPRDNLHAAVYPLDAPDAAGNAWAMEVGVTAKNAPYLSMRAMLDAGTLADAAVEQETFAWFHPGDTLERCWTSLRASMGSLFRRPELLVDGRCHLTEPDAMALLEHKTEMGHVGLDHERYANYRTAGTFGPRAQGAAHVRVRWELAGAVGDVPSLHGARFEPVLRVAVGDAELLLADAERLLRESSAAYLRVDERVVGRDDLALAIELLRARERVLERLGAAKGMSWAKTVELDDEWASERNAIATETRFASRWEEFLARLRDGSGVPLVKAPAGFKGSLRPYQERGLAWMAFLVENGFGGCLADDMGLGKTVQVLSLLATRRADKKKRAAPDLVVCPTAVVLNWQREAKKFTPSLKVYVHQGAGRALTPEALENKRNESDLVVTSFSIARIDRELLEGAPWGLVVIDEAQNLKNPDALQTRAVAALPSEARLALSGTPVENHLRDLWSIYHVVLPGLLGGPTRFARTFMAPIKHGDPRAMDRLTRRVAPFLLRRTKADPGVAVDLPPRQEQDVWCDLSREQVTLYQAMTEATLEGLTDAKGMQRRANILTALMRFKQICNHPENFHIEKPAKLFGRSGKLDRAMEIVDELLEGGQKVVIFTQFVEMGSILTRALAERFELDAGFYHGGLNPKEREALVDDFNSADGAPVLVLSLKAGGTGLNLQAASAVIHYDRWWNPAVEEQATARAHRIGQTRSVNVYKFVTRATLEERIVAMLESKRDLAERVLASSDESWITEMNNNDLAAFLALDRGAEVTDDAR